MSSNLTTDNKITSGRGNNPPIFGKYVIFSVSLFLITLLIASASFLLSKRQMIRDNKSSELTLLLEVGKIKLENSIKSKIAVIMQMSNSPLIRRHFADPSDEHFIDMALNEISSYREAVGSDVFWVSDSDKLFHIDNNEPYIVDPTCPANYWYNMTLYETETYNVNVNFNPALNVTNLWVNAPVFDAEDHRPIGMVGSGIDITEFIADLYQKDLGKTKLYFFNKAGEITIAKDFEIVAAKKNIKDVLGEVGVEAFNRKKRLCPGGVKTFTVPRRGQVAIFCIPALEWNSVAFSPDSLDDFNDNLTVLFLLMILTIALIIILSNWFVFGLIKTLRQSMTAIEEQNHIIMSGINYSGKIQRNLLPTDDVMESLFSDYSVIWRPRDVVGGDIYWVREFDKGTVLCVCDCTGHGTPGALLTMLAISTFEAVIRQENCDNTAEIIQKIDEKFAKVLKTSDENVKDGCDIAVLFIDKNKNISVSSGRMSVFVCDGNKTQRIKGQRIFVGEGNLTDKDKIVTTCIAANPDNKFYIASDGLFDQPGGENAEPFGYKALEKIILENHKEKQSAISDKIWKAFEEHRGTEPRVDDFELITFNP